MVIWGARVDQAIQGYIRVMLLITGIRSPQIFGSTTNHYGMMSSRNPLLRNLPKPKLSDDLFELSDISAKMKDM